MNNQVIKNIETSLSKELVVASNPDHPYLFVAPNILLANAGSIVAVFLPNKKEFTDPDQLLVKLAIAKLALPRHLRCVALIDHNNADQEFLDSIYSHFNEILDLSEYKSLIKFTKDKKAGKNLEK